MPLDPDHELPWASNVPVLKQQHKTKSAAFRDQTQFATFNRWVPYRDIQPTQPPGPIPQRGKRYAAIRSKSQYAIPRVSVAPFVELKPVPLSSPIHQKGFRYSAIRHRTYFSFIYTDVFTGGGGPTEPPVEPPTTDVDLPPSIPECPILQFEEQPQGNVVPFKPEVGPLKIRRRTSAKFWHYKVTFRMSNAQLLAFKNFYENTTEDGTVAFNWAHPVTKVNYEWFFVPGDDPVITRTAPNSSSVQVNLIRR